MTFGYWRAARSPGDPWIIASGRWAPGEDSMHQTMSRFPVAALATIALAALAIASCSNASSRSAGAARTASARATSVNPTTPAGPSTSASCPAGWRAGTTAVTRKVAVPPVPVATAIRIGSHNDCRFDRLVIDISGPLPGYTVGFVSKVIGDASGKTITMPGTRYLEIRLNPAQGHAASGTPSLPTAVHSAGYPMLASYAVAGDFEGVLTIALGLAGGTRYRVGELPGRIYVDVSW